MLESSNEMNRALLENVEARPDEEHYAALAEALGTEDPGLFPTVASMLVHLLVLRALRGDQKALEAIIDRFLDPKKSRGETSGDETATVPISADAADDFVRMLSGGARTQAQAPEKKGKDD